MKTIILKYYPIIIAFIAMLYSIGLGLFGYTEEAQTSKKIMNIIMFIVGAVIFTVFLIGIIWEEKTEEKVTDENYGYYARHQPEKDELK